MGVDASLVAWSRAQFALTAMYHWIFVPLTLGLSFIIAIMHTIYYKTNDETWKKITKFWMKLFGINFAIGVATGIILEFEFGTNWSNYSWFVGDIFGAPLAIEGILAFFMEATFVAVMFFGWDRVSKKFHLWSTWLTAIGTNLSAMWILIANAWMQHPQGMKFNPATARNEMASFADVVFNPTAVTKFIHTTSQAYLLAGIFVMGVSAWYLIRNREVILAKKSMLVGSAFALLASIYVVMTGDLHAHDVAHTQPMKFAAMEGLYKGNNGQDIVVFGIINGKKQPGDDQPEFHVALKIPKFLSFLAQRDFNAFVPGVNDVIAGYDGNLSLSEKIQKGKLALQYLKKYAEYKDNPDSAKYYESKFREVEKYMGYGYFDKPEEIVPYVPGVFYSFHLMVLFGLWMAFISLVMFLLSIRDKLEGKKFWLRATVWTILIAYITTQLGWVTAELGRQPWAITELLPVKVATSHLSVANVKTTFFMFLIIFTLLLIADVGITLYQIKKGAGISDTSADTSETSTN